MSDAIKKLHDYLAKSPSVVYPEDVLAYLPEIEAENAKLLDEMIDAYNDKVVAQLKADELRAEIAQLRKLVRDMACEYECGYLTLPQWLADRMSELGVEVASV